jgi:hypothetical protein
MCPCVSASIWQIHQHAAPPTLQLHNAPRLTKATSQMREWQVCLAEADLETSGLGFKRGQWLIRKGALRCSSSILLLGRRTRFHWSLPTLLAMTEYYHLLLRICISFQHVCEEIVGLFSAHTQTLKCEIDCSLSLRLDHPLALPVQTFSVRQIKSLHKAPSKEDIVEVCRRWLFPRRSYSAAFQDNIKTTPRTDD